MNLEVFYPKWLLVQDPSNLGKYADSELRSLESKMETYFVLVTSGLILIEKVHLPIV